MSKSTGRLSIFYLCIYLLNYISCACTSASSLQLVRPSIQDRALLEVNEEALSHIELIDDDLYIIGVIGPYHTGKSFLLNQLHGQNDGFCVGDTIDPQTMGIWAWQEPIKVNGKSILLLDCEGFFGLGASENYDAKLFSITTLLSSYLIFNTIKIIDQASAEYINLLAQRTQLFQLRAALQTESDVTSVKKNFIDFPDFLWLVRDFYQDLNGKTPQDWLEQYLSGKRSENSPKNIVENLFSSINCKTLPIPHKSLAALKDLSKTPTNELAEDFKHDMEHLRNDIFASLKPKKLFDEPISGPKFSWLIRMLVNASNTNSFPQVASIWDLFVNTSHSQLSEYCADQFSNTLFLVAQIPMPRKEWNKLIEQLTAKYVKIYENYLKDMNIKEKNNKVLLASLSDVATKHLQLTKDRFKQHLITTKDAQFDKAVTLFKTIPLPINSAILARKANEVLKFVRAEFVKELTSYDSKEENVEISAMKDTLEAQVQDQFRITDNSNSDLIKTLLSNAMDQSVIQYKSAKYTVPSSQSEMSSHHQKLVKEAVATFDTATKNFNEENLYKEYLQNTKDRLQAEFNKIESHNMEVIEGEKKELLKQLNEEILKDQLAIESKIPYLIEELEVLIAEKSVKIKQKYEKSIKKYEYKDIFDHGMVALQESIGAMSKQVLSRNDREYQTIFFKPLHKAAVAARKEAPSYSLYDSLVRRIRFLVSYYLQRNELGEARNISDATLKRVVDSWIEQEFSTILETKWKIFPLTNIISFFVNLFGSSITAIPADN